MRFNIIRYLFGRKAVAAAVQPELPLPSDAETLEERVMAAYNLRGLAGYTADECAEAISLGVLSVRPTVTKLFQQGKLRKTQVKRLNRSGVRAVVLVSTRIPSAATAERYRLAA